MDKKQRNLYLKKLARSSEGEALKEYFEERILKLKDLTTIESWEETIGRKLAIVEIEKIMRQLNLLKKEKPSSKRERYD